MKKTLIATAVAGSLMASSAMAGVSMNVGATSNYMWRGYTQSGEDAAISGGLDYAHDSGFYAGTWTSSLGGGQYELDGYLGFGGEFATDFSYDVGYIYYAYPIDDTVEADFGEIYGSIGWKGLTLFGAYQTNEEWSNAEDAYYLSLDYAFEYGDGFSTDILVGYYAGDEVKATFGDSYTHIYADVAKSTDYGDVSLALSIAQFDEDKPGALGVDKTWNDPRVIVSWGKEF
jgi:uncharacterized protein (TIGR02001 family)